MTEEQLELEAWIKAKDFPNPLSPETIETVKNSGAGFLADLAKQAALAGGSLELTGAAARDSGAGFVQDVLKTIEEPPPEPIGPVAIGSISNEVEAVVTTATAGDYALFPAGSRVRFEGTGNATLDAPEAEYYVLAADDTAQTFTVNADLSAEAAPITQGTVSQA